MIVFAQDEARALKHNYIGTEHLLLGLLREEEGLAARVLESLDITVDEARAQVAPSRRAERRADDGADPVHAAGQEGARALPPRGALLGHNRIGTEHILLGLVRENEGVAARILVDFDADAETIRNEVIRMLSGPVRRQQGGGSPLGETEGEDGVHVEFAAEGFDRSIEIDRGLGLIEIPPPRPWPLLLAIALAAVGFPLGLLVGFLIWG